MMHALSETINTWNGSLFIADSSGTVVYANKAIEDRTGFQVAEVVGKKPGQLWGGKMGREYYQWMWKIIRLEKCPYTGIVVNTHKAGREYSDTVHIAPLTNRVGEVEYYLEFHPAQSEKNFTSEFVDIFSSEKWKNGDLLFSWMQSSVSSDQKIQVEEESITLIRDLLVAHTGNLFQNRSHDTALVLAAKENPEAFSVLYRKYVKKIQLYFYHRVHDEDVREDLTQETFVKAFRYLPNFKLSNASYATYLQRIAHSLLIDYYRQKKEVSLDFLENEPSDIEVKDIVAIEAAIQAVHTLNEVEQQVIRMKYHEEMSVREIAILLGKTENAVKLHLSRGRKKLKGMLKL